MEGLTLPGRGSTGEVAECITESVLLTFAASPAVAPPNHEPWWPPPFIFSLAVLNGCVCSGGGALLRCPPAAAFLLASMWSSGMFGTGGTLRSLGIGLRPPGDGDRKVRSIMEPTLGVRRSWLPGERSLPPGMEATEGLLRTARLDWTSATLVGVMGRARNAAAAAADDSEALEPRRMNAEAAAVAALGSAVSLVRGCRDMAGQRGEPNKQSTGGRAKRARVCRTQRQSRCGNMRQGSI